MKATLGQRPAGVVMFLENELLGLLSEVAKFWGEEYWQRSVDSLLDPKVFNVPKSPSILAKFSVSL